MGWRVHILLFSPSSAIFPNFVEVQFRNRLRNTGTRLCVMSVFLSLRIFTSFSYLFIAEVFAEMLF